MKIKEKLLDFLIVVVAVATVSILLIKFFPQDKELIILIPEIPCYYASIT